MRISDWSSDVCSSDLSRPAIERIADGPPTRSSHGKPPLQSGQFSGSDQATIHGQCDAVRTAYLICAGSGQPKSADRKSVVSGKSVLVRVDLGGRRIIKKTKTRNDN